MRSVAAVAAALAVLAVSAPAGATSPAQKRFVKEANAACGRLVSEILGTKPLTTSRARLVLRRGWPRVRRRIEGLPVPSGDEARVRRIVVSFRRFGRALALVTAPAKREGDVLEAIGVFIVASKRAYVAANAYGLTTCARLIGKPRV